MTPKVEPEDKVQRMTSMRNVMRAARRIRKLAAQSAWAQEAFNEAVHEALLSGIPPEVLIQSTEFDISKLIKDHAASAGAAVTAK